MSVSPELLDRINLSPESPGCYIWKSDFIKPENDSEILYIGKARNIRNRLKQYLKSDDIKTRLLVSRAVTIEWITTSTEVEALLLESNLIKKYSPVYNIQLKDDKKYPYLCLSMSEMYPRLYITREKKIPGNLYYGPYTDVTAARNTLDMLHNIFPIRKRPLKLPLKKPVRPCLNYHLKRCLAPCAQLITKEKYSEMVLEIRDFLEGHRKELFEKLQLKMNHYSSKMKFEAAADIRDMISSLEKMINLRQSVHGDQTDTDYDIVGIYAAESRQLYAELNISNEDKIETAFGNIILLKIRNGNLIGKQEFSLGNMINNGNISDPKFLSECFEVFFRNYYLISRDYPETIWTSSRAFSSSIWEKALHKKSGLKSKIKHADTSANSQIRSLSQMAVENARLTLRESILRENIRNKRLGLKQIMNFLDLDTLPRIIECYDISNIQGKEAVASGIMLKEGFPYKPGYRRYKIRTKNTPDDPAMIYEVISRRMARFISGDEKQPDLMLIDGGITQLRAAIKARDEAGQKTVIVSLAKQEEEIYTSAGEILSFDKESPGMHIIRLARDESHRFAVSYHRILRYKRNLKSELSQISGIGELRLKKIQKYLASNDIENLTIEQLSQKLISDLKIPKDIADKAVEILNIK